MKISGAIDRSKKKEFEQTVRFVFNRICDAGTERQLYVEVNDDSVYHFYLEWQNELSLKKFRESEEYELMIGAYIALGRLGKTMYGYGHQVKNLYMTESENEN
jgi:hypothetical protein